MAYCNYNQNCSLGQLVSIHAGALAPSLWHGEGLSAPFLLGRRVRLGREPHTV